TKPLLSAPGSSYYATSLTNSTSVKQNDAGTS
ncbi:hypothetical protein L917_15609, partial [Phytophthora nicotianae]